MQDDAWDLSVIGIPELKVHPMHLVDDDDLLILEMYRAYRGGMGATGPLPEAGGYSDQPAYLMAAFAILAAADAAFRKKRERSSGKGQR